MKRVNLSLLFCFALIFHDHFSYANEEYSNKYLIQQIDVSKDEYLSTLSVEDAYKQIQILEKIEGSFSAPHAKEVLIEFFLNESPHGYGFFRKIIAVYNKADMKILDQVSIAGDGGNLYLLPSDEGKTIIMALPVMMHQGTVTSSSHIYELVGNAFAKLESIKDSQGNKFAGEYKDIEFKNNLVLLYNVPNNIMKGPAYLLVDTATWNPAKKKFETEILLDGTEKNIGPTSVVPSAILSTVWEQYTKSLALSDMSLKGLMWAKKLANKKAKNSDIWPDDTEYPTSEHLEYYVEFENVSYDTFYEEFAKVMTPYLFSNLNCSNLDNPFTINVDGKLWVLNSVAEERFPTILPGYDRYEVKTELREINVKVKKYLANSKNDTIPVKYKYFPVKFELIKTDTSKDIIPTRFVKDEWKVDELYSIYKYTLQSK